MPLWQKVLTAPLREPLALRGRPVEVIARLQLKPCPSGDHHDYRAPGSERAPAVGDPVVVEGTKYRIRTLSDDLWSAKTSFGRLTTSGQVADLTWDRIAGLWRVQKGAE